MRNPLIEILQLGGMCSPKRLQAVTSQDDPRRRNGETRRKSIEGPINGVYPKSGGRPAHKGEPIATAITRFRPSQPATRAFPATPTVVISKVTIRRTETSKNGLSESAWAIRNSNGQDPIPDPEVFMAANRADGRREAPMRPD